MALGGAELAHDRLGRVRGPVDRADLLGHERQGLARDPDAHGAGLAAALHRLDDRLDRGAADLVAVEAALARGAGGEAAVGPDLARVEVAVGLEHGHAPALGADLNRPVQRRGPAVASGAGVHHQAAVPGPHRLRDELLEDRADDQVRPVGGDRRLHGHPRFDHRHLDLVSHLGERDPRALAEAVVGGHEEEDAHVSQEAPRPPIDPVRRRTPLRRGASGGRRCRRPARARPRCARRGARRPCGTPRGRGRCPAPRRRPGRGRRARRCARGCAR